MDAQILPAAMQRAAECYVSFNHTRPNGGAFHSVLSSYGGARSATAENIAMGQRTAADVVNGWMKSGGHRTNILNANYTYIGIGCFYQPNGLISRTQLFSNGTHSTVSKRGTAQTVATVSADSSNIGAATLNLSAVSLSVGKTAAATLSVVNVGWNYTSFTPTPDSVTYSSSNSKVASVNSEGTVTAVAAGTAVITAKLTSFPQCSASATVSARNEQVSDWTQLESAHDYASNSDEWWIYTAPGADVSALNITFDVKTKTEASYDYLYLYDGAGRLIGAYSGVSLSGKSICIPGKTVKIRLTSDAYGNHWGFKVTALSEEHFTLSDALALYRFAAGESTLTWEQEFSFDLIGDDVVDFRDALALYRIVSGRLTA